jgi:hypothetical protein
LNDGIASTLGAVAEPYLSSMPSPDEFFPLLLTGKLTLAEVYWKTTPMTSWMVSFIGDPLYVPFKVNPQLKPEHCRRCCSARSLASIHQRPPPRRLHHLPAAPR